MNGGAYGREVKDILVSARLVLRSGEVVEWPLEKLGYTYRHSDVPEGAVVVEAVFRGNPGDPRQSARRWTRSPAPARNRSRCAAAPAARPSRTRQATRHGRWSMPPVVAALRIGDAQVSEKHCNFLLNLGSASSAEIEALGEEVRRRVEEKTHIKLEWEIQRVGVEG